MMMKRKGSSPRPRGLARTLLLWFLTLSLVPLVVTSVTAYRSAQERLYQSLSRHLVIASEYKAEAIEAFLLNCLTDLDLEARLPETRALLEDLTALFQASGRPIADFFGTYASAMFDYERCRNLKDFQAANGYNDVLLIDTRGNILYTATGEKDMAGNVFEGWLAKTVLGQTCRRAFDGNIPVISDFEYYGLTNNKIAGFCVRTVLDEQGKKIGLLAFQLKTSQIVHSMRKRRGNWEGESTFLTGPDFALKSGFVAAAAGPQFQIEFISPEESRWYADHIRRLRAEKRDDIPIPYLNARGVPVLGMHLDLEIEGTAVISPMGIVVEIDQETAFAPLRWQRTFAGMVTGLTMLLVALAALLITRRLVRPVRTLSDAALAVAQGDLSRRVEASGPAEIAGLARDFNHMIDDLWLASEAKNRQDWIKTGRVRLHERMRGDPDPETLSRAVLECLAESLPLVSARLLGHNPGGPPLALWHATASAPLPTGPDEAAAQALQTGQCVLRPEYPALWMPLLFEGRTRGVLELFFDGPWTEAMLEYVQLIAEDVAVSLQSAASRHQVRRLLDQTRAQADTLELQQARLQDINRQLEQASRYKSEFLANMSHELRSPLNSILILARLMAENKEGTLTPKQVEFAQTIFKSGTGLLDLINDILDLSKVEAGKLDIHPADTPVRDFCAGIESPYRYLAQEKGLFFHVEIDPEVPPSLVTDSKRLGQIVKNLLANAFKFTEKGGVTLRVHRTAPGGDPAPENAVVFSVIDTGIGIPADKQQIIFEAFRQADGSTSRRYGGTGLGLTISRHLAQLLGGEIRLRSVEGSGSEFSLLLPPEFPLEAPPITPPAAPQPVPPPAHPESTPLLLVIEDDLHFAGIVRELAVRKGFRVNFAPGGMEGAQTAASLRPDAVLLDICLPDIDGLAVLARLRKNPRTQAIPVHVVSVFDRPGDALALGAVSYHTKPISLETLDGTLDTILRSLGKNPVPAAADLVPSGAAPARADDAAPPPFLPLDGKTLLLADDDMRTLFALSSALEARNATVWPAKNGAEALETLRLHPETDLVLMDADMPGMDGFETIRRIRREPHLRALPILVLTEPSDPAGPGACLEAGATGYLQKPVDMDALDKQIRALLRLPGAPPNP